MKFKLSDVANVTMGQSPKSEFFNDTATGEPFLQGVRTFGRLYPTIDTYTTEYNRLATQGSILFSVRAPVGQLNWANQDIAIGRGLAAIAPVYERVNPDYLYYLLKSMGAAINSQSNGTVFTSINKTELNNLDLELPELAQQEKFGTTLRLLDDKIESLSEINDNLLELAQQIFVGKYLSKQDSFPMTTLSEIVGVKTDTFNPKKSNDNEVAHFSLPAFDSGSVPTVDLVDSIKSNKNIITQYTVLASKMNPTTKRVWIPNYVQGMTNVASTEFLTFNASDEYQQAFIWAVVDSEGYQNHLISGATGSTGSRQRIKPGDAYSFEVGYNPDEAHRIGMILNPLLQQVKNNRDEIVTLVQLRNNLLTNLLN